jgi:hypothetical protein
MACINHPTAGDCKQGPFKIDPCSIPLPNAIRWGKKQSQDKYKRTQGNEDEE